MPPKQFAPGRLRAYAPANADDSTSAAFALLGTPDKTHPRRDTGPPRAWLCQLGVALSQASFVVGSVYLKGSLALVDSTRGERFSPIVYAFGREITAGPLLYAIAWLSTGVALPAAADAWRVVALGACMFLAQLLYIIGIELSGVVVATCIQPAIPVFTVLLGVLLKMEAASAQKLLGVGLAVSGAVTMVLGGASGSPSTHSINKAGESSLAAAAAAAASASAIGNACLLTNCLAMASYYIFAKKLLVKYSPAQVSAWAYIVAAALMGAAAAAFTTPQDWNFPRALLLPLAYWVLVCSVGGYYVVTWAMCHLPASQVASFQCLQPFLGSLLAFLVLHERPSWYDAGAIGVLAGLLLVTQDKRDAAVGGASGGMMGRMRSAMGMARSRSRTGGALVLPTVKEVE